jgi:hypothetical protein
MHDSSVGRAFRWAGLEAERLGGVTMRSIAFLGLAIGTTLSVTLLPGHLSADGLTADGDQLWHRDITDIEDLPKVDDLFGPAVATGGFFTPFENLPLSIQ